jgi:hypothetical protein
MSILFPYPIPHPTVMLPHQAMGFTRFCFTYKYMRTAQNHVFNLAQHLAESQHIVALLYSMPARKNDFHAVHIS